MSSTTLMIAAEHGSGNQGDGIYYEEECGAVAVEENTWAEVAVRERYTAVTRILGRQFTSPFEAFGILAWAN